MTSFPGASSSGTREVPGSIALARTGRGAGQVGFTLMELLTVVLIISLLGGLSAAVFQVVQKNFDLAGSSLQIEGIIQAARNTAISSASHVRVVADPVRRRVEARAFRTVGEWSFEETDGETTLGAPMELATLKGASAAEGHIGQGLAMKGGFVDCGESPRFDLRLGVQIEAWVNLAQSLVDPLSSPESDGRAVRGSSGRGSSRGRRTSVGSSRGDVSIVLQREGAYYLGVTPDGRVEAGIGAGGGLEPYRVRTPPEAVRPGRWQRLAMSYDGLSLEVSVDGIPRPLSVVGYESSKPENLPPLPDTIAPGEGPLTLGAEKNSFPGRIDEVKLRGLVEPVVYEIPETQLLLGWKKVLHFDRRGHLDPRHHDRPVRLVLIETRPEDRRPATGKTGVVRDFSKTFGRWSRDNGQDLEGLRQEVEEAKIESQYPDRRKEVLVIDRLGVIR